MVESMSSETLSTSFEHVSPQVAIPPFWQRLNKFFLFPLQAESLIYGLALAACSLFVYVPLLGPIILLVLMLAISRYAFKIAALSSYGIFNLDEYTPMQEEDEWKKLPWKFVGAVFIQLMALVFVVARVPELAPIGFLLFSLLLPATLMVLIKEHSLASAINPQELWGCVTGVGWPYLVLCAFTFLLMQGYAVAYNLLEAIIPTWLFWPGSLAVFTYFAWVNAALIGYTMYQYHFNLGIDIINEYQGEEQEGQPAPNAREAGRQRDAAISRMVQQGQLAQALEQARQWLHDSPNSLAEHRRYHRLLMLDTDVAERQRHGQQWIELLLKNRSPSEALQVYKDCAHNAPTYVPQSAVITLALAKDAWKANDGALALQLLRGFDKRFPSHPLTPDVYALIVRVLQQGLGRHEQAMAVFQGLQRRYPQSPHTLEVARILKQPAAPSIDAKKGGF